MKMDRIGDELACGCCSEPMMCPQCEGGPLVVSAVSTADDNQIHAGGYICKACGCQYNAHGGPGSLELVRTLGFDDLQARIEALEAYRSEERP